MESLLREIERREDEQGEELIGEPARAALRSGNALVVRSGDGLGVLTPTPEDGWGLDVVATAGDYQGVVDEALNRGGDRGSIRLWVRDGEGGDPRFQPERRLLIMGRPLPAPEPQIPEGLVIRPFDPAGDKREWLRVNNDAFKGHPENGGWTDEDLEARLAADWFDPDGLRMAWEGDVLAGSCWIKQHPKAVGEIHIIAVASSHRGRGLGKALVLEAMQWMTEHGDTDVILYTESNNPAVRLYENLGFETSSVLESLIYPGRTGV